MEKFCQSCGMPLFPKEKDQRGTESDGTFSLIYCDLCYRDGAFIEPDITYEEMLHRGQKGIREGRGNKVIKFVMTKGYPFQLKKLSRWKKK